MRKRDCILIAALIIISLSAFFFLRPYQKGGSAYIYRGDSLYGTYDLSEDRIIRIDNDDGTVNEVEITGGSVCMLSAGCPNKLCVNSGSISLDKESICCAPERILIVVRADEAGEYDAVTK
ncbi:MAG: NusG domain II-containing protein [Lachnospiraceae bacterium]|nr:NusG domain II-containing protein [Lachnospiraceae bacterium]